MINPTIHINGRFLVRPISGVERYSIEITNALIENGLNVVVVAPKKAINQKHINNTHVKYIGKFSGHFWEQLVLPRYLSKNKKPVLLNLANTAPIFYKNKICTLHDIAYLINPNWFNSLFVMLYKIIIPIILKGAKHIFTVSEFSKSSISEAYNINKDKITVTYNGLSKSLINKQSTHKPLGYEYVLTVGSLQPRKNILKLIEAYNLIGSPKFKLVIVGVKNKSFKSENLNINNNENIVFFNNISDNELATLYKNCSKYICASLYEGFGLPILEALHYNCTVVISNIPVFKELFNEIAYFFNPNLVSEIKNALTEKHLKKDENDIINRIKNYNFAHSANIIKQQIERVKSSIRT